MVCPNVEESLHNDFLGMEVGPTYYSHSLIMWNLLEVSFLSLAPGGDAWLVGTVQVQVSTSHKYDVANMPMLELFTG